jgi:hypothetical protein
LLKAFKIKNGRVLSLLKAFKIKYGRVLSLLKAFKIKYGRVLSLLKAFKIKNGRVVSLLKAFKFKNGRVVSLLKAFKINRRNIRVVFTRKCLGLFMGTRTEAGVEIYCRRTVYTLLSSVRPCYSVGFRLKLSTLFH